MQTDALLFCVFSPKATLLCVGHGNTLAQRKAGCERGFDPIRIFILVETKEEIPPYLFNSTCTLLSVSNTNDIRQKRRLMNGRMMTCPRCKKPSDILKFVPLRMIEEFADETTPVYKCPECRWIFAPADNFVKQMLLLGFDEKRSNQNEVVLA